MTIQAEQKPDVRKIIGAILTCSLVIILPAIEWSLFGWLHMLLPLLAFLVLGKYGGYTGKRFLLTALALAAIVLTLLNSFDLFIFSAVFLLSGYVLFTSTERQDTIAICGLKTCVTLAVGWTIILGFFTFGAEISPYNQLLQTLDQGIGEALTYYRQSDTVSGDTMIVLETTLYQMKVLVPIIMPAILGSIILLVTWFTMVIGNNLLLKINSVSPWVSYGYWSLPDKLIWVVIITALASLVPVQSLKFIGINGIILLSIIYAFQGLAVAVFYMNKWSVPILLRSFFYVMMILQSFGTIVLIILGIADIWFDFRKLKQQIVNEEK